ncbi:MAG TPA: nickel-dependent hydrogenase large subunit [Nitrospira sp.]|nr:nickel-dependent hydrogenase large subunit [Nitrospira sp.]
MSKLNDVPLAALQSTTIGRHAARGALRGDDGYAEGSMADTGREHRQGADYLQRVSFPKGKIKAVGFHEAPRRTLSHWLVIENYQAVVPRTWNVGPCDPNDQIVSSKPH